MAQNGVVDTGSEGFDGLGGLRIDDICSAHVVLALALGSEGGIHPRPSPFSVLALFFGEFEPVEDHFLGPDRDFFDSGVVL